MTARGVVRALGALGFAALVPAGAVGAQEAATVAPAAPQAGQVVGYAVSSRDASLTFHLADGSELRLALRGGDVLVNGDDVGDYARDGQLGRAWEALLLRAADLSTDQMLVALKQLDLPEAAAEERTALEQLQAPLTEVRPAEADVTVPVAPSPPDADAALAEAEALRESAHEMRDAIRESIRETFRDGPRQTIRETLRGDRGPAFADPGSVPGGVLSLVGAFLALAGIGFGLSFFAERQLDIVADTASASVARSFFVGLFAQPLLLPAFGMMIAGLVLTVIGVLVVPFAILAFVAVLAAALIGGYLAMARAVGEAFARKRGTKLEAGGFGTLRKTLFGLGILLSIWVPAVLLGWVPLAGVILTWTALVVTWAILTTGFGAAILTRGGLRGTFGRRFRPQPLGELAWPATEPETASRFDTGEWLGRKGT